MAKEYGFDIPASDRGEKNFASVETAILHKLEKLKADQPEMFKTQSKKLAVLFLDIKGFSKVQGEDKRAKMVEQLWKAGKICFKNHGGEYINTWGDAIVAGFEDINAGLESACDIIATLKELLSITARIGISYGKVWIRFNPLIGRHDMGGGIVNEAARLEPMANECEILASPEVDKCKRVNRRKFAFADTKRELQKGIGEDIKGIVWKCFVVTRKTG